MPERPFGNSAVMSSGWNLWPVMLLLATLVLFPIIFAWPYFPPLQGQGLDALGSFGAAIFDRTCPSRSGSPFPSAVHASLRNALFAIPDLDDRAKQVTECMYGDKAATIATRWQALVPLFQSILSAILIFAIGTAVRNRLRIR